MDLDFHTVAANRDKEPPDKHYVFRRSRRQTGILVFRAREAEERVLGPSNAAIPKFERAHEILQFADFWRRQTEHVPEELVFDSQLATCQNLAQLTEQGIRFPTLRRCSRNMLAEIQARPASAWRRVTLEALMRTCRHPRVLDGRIPLPDYGEQELRQLSGTLDKRAHNPCLADAGLADQRTPMPWLSHWNRVIRSS